MADQQPRRPSGPTFRFVGRSSPNPTGRANSPQIQQQVQDHLGMHHSASMPQVQMQQVGRPMLVQTQPIQPPPIHMQQGGPRQLQPVGPPQHGMGRGQMMIMSPAVSGGAGSPASSTSSGGFGRGAGDANSPDPVNKCIRFFKTLINLSTQNRGNEDPVTVQANTIQVKNLIRNVVYDAMPVDMFTSRLQEVLKSTTQPNLLPFLQKTLPIVREGVRRGDIHIEGISPPPPPNNEMDMRPQNPHAVGLSRQQPPMHMGIPNQSYQPSTTLQHPITRQQMTHAHMPPPTHVQTAPMGPPPSQIQLNQPVRSPKIASSKTEALDEIVASVASGGRQQQSHQVHHPPPMPKPVEAVPVQVQPQQQQQQQQHHHQQQQQQHQQQQQEEESVQVRTYNEPLLKYSLLNADEVMKRITKRMTEPCYLEEEMLILLSDVCESRLREILGELATLAEHRLDPLRLNPNYLQVDDTKRQLKFLEELDRQREEQRENREKDAIYRMSKSKGVDKNIAEKAKEMQRADAEAKRNREANEAAIAALGKSNKPKWDQVTGGTTTSTYRPRTVRANLRDLQALMLSDPRCSRSQVLHKLTLMGPPTTDTL
ncbi:hypothetical protein WR25_04247 [Diploscapter pachys]|uniref:TAFH domain-containing protein n=1 Tax=Diploscapter pachys TaxID=2018661 RepID=A0A2A2K1H9_9BILA|nr:hypothetical protein WR25_04247 [Diploscapter pachys]